MPIELVDESDIKSETKVPIKAQSSGGILKIVSREDTVSCERSGAGMTNDCVLCENLNKKIFDKCTNKYASLDGL